MEVTGFVAGKLVTLQGVQYQPGDPVDVSELPDHKLRQLLNQRILRPSVAVAEEQPSEQSSQN